MKDAEDATHRVGHAARGAAGGYREMGRAAEESSAKLKELHDRHRMNSDRSEKDLEEMRKNTSGTAQVSKEYMDQQIAQRYGTEFVGNSKAEQAFGMRAQLAAYRENYGNVTRSQESLNEQHAVMKALDRLEQEIEQERNKSRLTSAPSRSDISQRPPQTSEPLRPSQPSQPPQPPQPRQTYGGGGSASITPAQGASAGATYISNITIPGIGSASVRFADSGSQAQTEVLLSQLARAKSVSR